MDADGDYVVVWGSENQDGDADGVYGQRFRADGTPQGDDFVVNTYTPGGQVAPSVAAAPAGGFVILWSGSMRGALAPPGEYRVRLTVDGNPVQAAVHFLNDASTPVASYDLARGGEVPRIESHDLFRRGDGLGLLAVPAEEIHGHELRGEKARVGLHRRLQ